MTTALAWRHTYRRGRAVSWRRTTAPSSRFSPHHLAGLVGWFAGDRLDGYPPLAVDDFLRADASDLGTAPTGGAWQTPIGLPWRLVGNKAAPGATVGQVYASSVDVGADLSAQVDLTLSTTADRSKVGLAFRGQDRDNQLAVVAEDVSGTNRLALVKVVAGVVTVLASDATVNLLPGSTYRVRVEALSNSIGVYLDGILRFSHTLSAGDQTTFGARRRVGLRADVGAATDDGASRADNFVVRPPTLADLAAVGLWPDRSGSRNHARQTTTANKPTRVAAGRNGRPVVRFDGTNDGLQSAQFTAGVEPPPNTIVAVLSHNTTALQTFVDGTGAGRNLVDLTASGATPIYRAFASASLLGGIPVVSTPKLLAAVVDGAQSLLRVDGRTVGAGTTGSANMAGITIGVSNDLATRPMNGDVAEVIVYGRRLSVAELAKVESYLAAKYALTLAA